MRRARHPAQGLRGAIDCMPIETRVAMRDAIAANSIIVGAYTDRHGGVCPMLAAHRNGGRTSFAAFARAWDRYTRAGDGPRRATGRELRTLSAMLDASIAAHAQGATDLGAAITEHRASRERTGGRRQAAGPRATGERDRTRELWRRHGWAWLRPFRRLDDYERALDELEEDRPEAERRLEAERLPA